MLLSSIPNPVKCFCVNRDTHHYDAGLLLLTATAVFPPNDRLMLGGLTRQRDLCLWLAVVGGADAVCAMNGGPRQ